MDEQPGKPTTFLYPNPGTGEVILHSNIAYREANVKVIDLTGRTLKEIHYDIGDGWGQEIILNLDNLNNGLYYVRFQVDDLKPVTLKYILAK